MYSFVVTDRRRHKDTPTTAHQARGFSHEKKRKGHYISVPLIQVGPLGYFIPISITTPVVSALKNQKLLYMELSRSSFASETTARWFQK
jgi:hypothetical protein